MLPASVFLFMFAPDVIALVFHRGAFNERAVVLTSQALRRVAQIGDIDIVIGPFVAGRHHQNHVVFHKGFDFDVSAHSRALDERELDAVLDESFEDLLGVASGDSNFDARVVFEEGGYQTRQEILADGVGGGDGEASGGISGGCGDGLAGFFGERGKFIGVGEQGFACGGESDSSSAAVEEGDGELGFEGLDLLGYGGLGEEEFFGGLAEVQVTGDGAEDAEAEVFHSDQSTACERNWLSHSSQNRA
jgi:hypothetical protein